jgi:hypothetical protein
MSNLDQARESHLRNILTRTGKRLDDFRAAIAGSGLKKHSEIRALLMQQFGLGYGDANALVHFALSSDGQSAAEAAGIAADDVAANLYAGAKAPLRPVHEALMQTIRQFGPCEVVPKKGYVSLRRKRQFAMIGPASKGRVEVGLNMKGGAPSDRLLALPPGGMAPYKVYLSTVEEVDAELVGWLRQAYESAG